MFGALYELCSGQSCSPERSERMRALFDGLPIPPRPPEPLPACAKGATATAEPHSPNLLTRMATAGAAGMDWAKSGFQMRTPAEQAEILEICKGCEHFNAANTSCRECGCYLNLKARLKSARCPLDPPRW